MSPLRPRANSQAVKALIAMPIPATTETVEAGDDGRVAEPLHRLEHDRAERDEQQQRVGERGEDRRSLQPISEALGRRAPRQRRAAPGDREPEHVGQIVPRIGEQGDRPGPQAGAALGERRRRC